MNAAQVVGLVRFTCRNKKCRGDIVVVRVGRAVVRGTDGRTVTVTATVDEDEGG